MKDTLVSTRLPALRPTRSPVFILVLLALGVVLVNLFVFGLAGISLSQSHRQYQERAEITTRNLTQTLENELVGHLASVDVALLAAMDEYLRQGATGRIDGAALNAHIERLRARLPEIDALRIADARGRLVYGNDVAPGANTSVADRRHFIHLRDTPEAGLTISRPQVSRVNGKWVIVLARRLNRPDGGFDGIAFAAITLEHLAQSFAALDVGPNGIVTLRETGMSIVVRHPEPKGIGSVVGQTAAPAPLRTMVEAGRKAGTYQALSTVDGTERTFSFRRVGNYPYLIIVGLATVDYFAEWRRAAAKLTALAGLFALITLAAAWLIYRFWIRQLKSVMALAEQEAKFRTLADFTYDWEYWQGPDGQILYMTPSCERVTGYTQADFAADPGLLLAIIHPDDRAIMDRHPHGELDQGESRLDFRIVRRDGEIRWIAHHRRPVSGPDGEALGRRVSNIDITERKQAEAKLRESEHRHRLLVENSPPCIHEIDLAGRIASMNSSGLHMMGLERECGICGYRYLDAVCDADRARIADLLDRAIAGETSHFEFKASGAAERFYKSCFVPIKDENGAVIRLMGITEDITEHKRAEAQMREALVVFGASSQAIMTTDADGTITSINPAFAAITGYDVDEAVGRKPSILKSGRHDSAFYQAIWEALARTGHWEGEVWNRRKNGEIYPQWQTISSVRDEAGQITEYVALFSDITQRKQQEETIWHQANFDSLTGLANRSLLLDRLDLALAQARRNDKKVGLLFLDLDGFKWINDTLGHDVGDALLVEVAQRLKGCVREQDTVARLGGDEFTLVIGDLSDAADLHAIGEKTVAVLRQPFVHAGVPHWLSASVGITVFPDDGGLVQTLLKNADIAMYQAKQAGKNRFQFYAHHMQVDAQARMRLETDLREAIANAAFVLHYQPVVDADSGELVGAEALIRWQHPVRGLVSPLEFIPVAEDCGLIVAIGEWALREAARQWRDWREQGRPPLHLAVNVSSVQFREAGLPELVAEVMAEHGIDRGGLVLEITESVLMDGSGEAEARMHAIKALGIGYALDDFGTGFSSLSYLKRFPVDIVKIDRSFVHDCPDDRSDAHLVEAIVSMAHSLDLKVVAEGVETEAQMDFLRDLGCDFMQGYLIGKPLPADEFAALFARDRLLPRPDGADLEQGRLLAALRQDELDIDDWLRRLLGEQSPLLAGYQAGQGWESDGLNLKHAIQAHLLWRRRLNDYVSAKPTAEPMEPDHACSISRCELGLWIGNRLDHGGPRMAHLDRAHRLFHKMAGQIVADYNLGNREYAYHTCAGLKFREASRNVVVALIECFKASDGSLAG